jgi:hypothetical protein
MPTPPDAPLTPTPPTTSVAAAATPAVVVAKGADGGRWLNLLLGLAAVVAIGGVAFAIGRSAAPTDAIVSFPDGGMVTGPIGSFDPGAGPQVPGGGPALVGAVGPTIEGTVTALDGDSMTIAVAGGGELTIALDEATTYHEATDADASAVAVGDEVAVQADGGRFAIGGGDGAGGQTDPGLTAADVTVRR